MIIIKKMLPIILIVILFIGCSKNKNGEAIKIKPEKVQINGPLNGYIEIEDNEYELTEDWGGNLSVKIKCLKPFPANDLAKLEFILAASLLGDNGMPISGTGDLKLEGNSHEKLLNLLKQGNGTEVIQLKSMVGEYKALEQGDKVKKFSITSSTKASEGTTTSSTSTSLPGLYAFASERLLTDSEIEGYSKDDLKIMRNEIFARHGFIFKTDDMKNYFSTQSWYKPEFADVTNKISALEKSNIETIKKREPFAPATSVDGYESSSSYDNSSSDAGGSSNFDEMMRSYEEYINQYVVLIKKAKNNDMSALSEYPAMLQKANDLNQQLSRMQGQMTQAQATKFIKLQSKLTQAAF